MPAGQARPCSTGFVEKETFHALIKVYYADYRVSRLWSSAHAGHGQALTAHCVRRVTRQERCECPASTPGPGAQPDSTVIRMGRPSGDGEPERSAGRSGRHLQTGRGSREAKRTLAHEEEEAGLAALLPLVLASVSPAPGDAPGTHTDGTWGSWLPARAPQNRSKSRKSIFF